MLITIFMNGQKKFLWISCNSWRIWFRTTISLKIDSFLHGNEQNHAIFSLP